MMNFAATRRSFVSAKEEASMSSEEVDAEARRVFIEYDANADRRIDTAGKDTAQSPPH